MSINIHAHSCNLKTFWTLAFNSSYRAWEDKCEPGLPPYDILFGNWEHEISSSKKFMKKHVTNQSVNQAVKSISQTVNQ